MYAYSVVGVVAYSMKTPQPSARPAREMIIVPDSSSMEAVGDRRVHVVPDPVYSAMLLVARLAVSVIQMEVVEAYTNPYGLNAYATAPATWATTPPPPEEMGGAVLNAINPPPAGMGVVDESVYISTLLW